MHLVAATAATPQACAAPRLQQHQQPPPQQQQQHCYSPLAHAQQSHRCEAGSQPLQPDQQHQLHHQHQQHQASHRQQPPSGNDNQQRSAPTTRPTDIRLIRGADGQTCPLIHNNLHPAPPATSGGGSYNGTVYGGPQAIDGQSMPGAFRGLSIAATASVEMAAHPDEGPHHHHHPSDGAGTRSTSYAHQPPSRKPPTPQPQPSRPPPPPAALTCYQQPKQTEIVSEQQPWQPHGHHSTTPHPHQNNSLQVQQQHILLQGYTPQQGYPAHYRQGQQQRRFPAQGDRSQLNLHDHSAGFTGASTGSTSNIQLLASPAPAVAADRMAQLMSDKFMSTVSAVCSVVTASDVAVPSCPVPPPTPLASPIAEAAGEATHANQRRTQLPQQPHLLQQQHQQLLLPHHKQHAQRLDGEDSTVSCTYGHEFTQAESSSALISSKCRQPKVQVGSPASSGSAVGKPGASLTTILPPRPTEKFVSFNDSVRSYSPRRPADDDDDASFSSSSATCDSSSSSSGSSCSGRAASGGTVTTTSSSSSPSSISRSSGSLERSTFASLGYSSSWRLGRQHSFDNNQQHVAVPCVTTERSKRNAVADNTGDAGTVSMTSECNNKANRRLWSFSLPRFKKSHSAAAASSPTRILLPEEEGPSMGASTKSISYSVTAGHNVTLPRQSSLMSVEATDARSLPGILKKSASLTSVNDLLTTSLKDTGSLSLKTNGRDVPASACGQRRSTCAGLISRDQASRVLGSAREDLCYDGSCSDPAKTVHPASDMYENAAPPSNGNHNCIGGTQELGPLGAQSYRDPLTNEQYHRQIVFHTSNEFEKHYVMPPRALRKYIKTNFRRLNNAIATSDSCVSKAGAAASPEDVAEERFSKPLVAAACSDSRRLPIVAAGVSGALKPSVSGDLDYARASGNFITSSCGRLGSTASPAGANQAPELIPGQCVDVSVLHDKGSSGQVIQNSSVFQEQQQQRQQVSVVQAFSVSLSQQQQQQQQHQQQKSSQQQKQLLLLSTKQEILASPVTGGVGVSATTAGTDRDYESGISSAGSCSSSSSSGATDNESQSSFAGNSCGSSCGSSSSNDTPKSVSPEIAASFAYRPVVSGGARDTTDSGGSSARVTGRDPADAPHVVAIQYKPPSAARNSTAAAGVLPLTAAAGNAPPVAAEVSPASEIREGAATTAVVPLATSTGFSRGQPANGVRAASARPPVGALTSVHTCAGHLPLVGVQASAQPTTALIAVTASATTVGTVDVADAEGHNALAARATGRPTRSDVVRQPPSALPTTTAMAESGDSDARIATLAVTAGVDAVAVESSQSPQADATAVPHLARLCSTASAHNQEEPEYVNGVQHVEHQQRGQRNERTPEDSNQTRRALLPAAATSGLSIAAGEDFAAGVAAEAVNVAVTACDGLCDGLPAAASLSVDAEQARQQRQSSQFGQLQLQAQPRRRSSGSVASSRSGKGAANSRRKPGLLHYVGHHLHHYHSYEAKVGRRAAVSAAASGSRKQLQSGQTTTTAASAPSAKVRHLAQHYQQHHLAGGGGTTRHTRDKRHHRKAAAALKETPLQQQPQQPPQITSQQQQQQGSSLNQLNTSSCSSNLSSNGSGFLHQQVLQLLAENNHLKQLNDRLEDQLDEHRQRDERREHHLRRPHGDRRATGEEWLQPPHAAASTTSSSPQHVRHYLAKLRRLLRSDECHAMLDAIERFVDAHAPPAPPSAATGAAGASSSRAPPTEGAVGATVAGGQAKANPAAQRKLR